MLTVVGTFSRFSPVLNPRFSYRGEEAERTLEATCAGVGYPKTIRADQGSEFISRDLHLWAHAKGVAHLIHGCRRQLIRRPIISMPGFWSRLKRRA